MHRLLMDSRIRRVTVVLTVLSGLALATQARATGVTATITADNAYTLGCGQGSFTAVPGAHAEACLNADITSCATGPETYTFSCPKTDYIYVVAYDDEGVTQGLLAKFTGSRTITSGASNWQVYATNIDVDPTCPGGTGAGPSVATINAQIAIADANSGGAGTSKGWVNVQGALPNGSVGVGALAIGEPNDNLGGTFPQVCTTTGLGTDPKWMWYNPNYPSITPDPFAGSTTGEFLIFRLPVAALDFEGFGAVITSDNAYSIALGTNTEVNGFLGHAENCLAGDIFNCSGLENYSGVVGGKDEYIYLVAYDDESSTQGILGNFTGFATVTTGTSSWRVFATGIDVDPTCPGGTGTGPSVATVNQQIAIANVNGGGAGTSKGWVDNLGKLPDGSNGVGALAIGEPNDNLGGTFPQACTTTGMGTVARWMWYNPNYPSTVPDPFAGSTTGEFLIFRVPISAFQVPALPAWGMSLISALLLGAGTWFLITRRRRPELG